MNEKHRPMIGFLKLLDLGVVVCSFVLTTVLLVRAEHGISLSEFLSMRTKISNFMIFILMLIVCHVIFTICGMYRSRRLSSRKAEFVDILNAMAVITVCFVAFSWLFTIQMITIPFLAIFCVLSTVTLLMIHGALRRVAVHLRVQGRDLRYMLILGTNPRAVEFARRISGNPQRGYRILGFVDDEWPGIAALRESEYQVVSDYAGLAEYLRRNIVDEVAIYLPFGSFYKYSAEVAHICQQHGIIMRINSDIFGVKTSRWHAEECDGDQYITTYTGFSEFWPKTAKRMLDIAVATSALLFLSPVLLAAAIAIKLSSPGPIMFLQDRIGVNKRRFKIYKFRTMVPNAEKLMGALEKQNEVAGPAFKMKSDPRITIIGKFLRRSSIDELPQLLNVLKGDMSLVGPRPLPVRDFEGFNEDWQRRRFSVKPGITCLWQVNGRSGISFDEWMRLDLEYMDQWSLWLDMKILVRTVPAVFKGTGAV